MGLDQWWNTYNIVNKNIHTCETAASDPWEYGFLAITQYTVMCQCFVCLYKYRYGTEQVRADGLDWVLVNDSVLP